MTKNASTASTPDRRTMIADRCTTIRRTVSGLLALVVISTTLAGCVLHEPDTRDPRRTEPPVSENAAKRQMVEAVDDATGRLGGEWKARTGPDYAEGCVLEDGERGAHWRYLTGSTMTGRPDADAARMTEHWEGQGMRVTQHDSSDGPAIFGDGAGKVVSISVYAYSGNYTVQAVSLCFPGDPDEL
ncbi:MULTISPECIES: hypothetical protein [Curtobacterium]|uniref:Uncharacterized protein n=1 Tax=Curtobacterium poinsettiae TaxID=159612 RepID=A0ABT3S4J6_9MICO|nr:MULTISPECIES: hypothetical protein [Curtobacterium]MBT1609399.1 hypothetical protein [Curtobacterium flaccumfaciens pv. poinsettiae]MCX2849367.1 hypothetical protein [Curtobacterium flaccumfaciens pv. poinsettiae]UXN17939.1 hypothetical protein N8D78_13930 [Curtobacterium flaccumfaciens pv. poinsettiae]